MSAPSPRFTASPSGLRIHATLRAAAAPLFVLAASCGRHATPAAQASRDAGVPDGPCGAWQCTPYASAGDAFLAAIAGAPLVIGIGEAHAPLGATVPSAATRFARELLPLLRGRASDLLLELMLPPSGCVDATAAARAQEEPVHERQAPNDRAEYVALGEAARELGIVPDLLRPSCGDLEALRADDAGGIDAWLVMTARLSVHQAERLVDRDARSAADGDRGKAVIVYGGALHNDLSPSPGTERWSYAPALDAYTGGRFVAVDLIVPEYIGDDAAWRALPWTAAYEAAGTRGAGGASGTRGIGASATLFRMGPRSYVLVFPRTHREADGGSGARADPR